jgi:hypothetical protein
MSSCSQLPTWISYLQALAVPLAVVVAAFSVWIAAWQMAIAHDNCNMRSLIRFMIGGLSSMRLPENFWQMCTTEIFAKMKFGPMG